MQPLRVVLLLCEAGGTHAVTLQARPLREGGWYFEACGALHQPAGILSGQSPCLHRAGARSSARIGRLSK